MKRVIFFYVLIVTLNSGHKPNENHVFPTDCWPHVLLSTGKDRAKQLSSQFMDDA